MPRVLEAVRDYQWEDGETVIKGSIGAWRGSFPRARRANVCKWPQNAGFRRAPVVDADFVHFVGLPVIDNCRQATITGAVFAHLQGIQALGMYECRADQVATARSLGLRVNTRGCASYGSLLYTFDERGFRG